jgi:hypothetical protein
MFVPLVDNEFNRAKSNIAWLEGTWAGAKTIASDLPEFNKPGVTVYKPGELPRNNFTPDSEISWDYISKNLTLDLINASREHILDTLYQQVK